MATIWAVYEGKDPTLGGPWARLPVSEAISLFELRPDDLVSDLEHTPRFGDHNLDLTYLGIQHIVIEIGPKEAKAADFKPGYYKSKVSPDEAYERLIRQALVSELGADNVLRVKIEPTQDSENREALKVTVVISPAAAQEFEGSAILDAMVKLQNRLRDMRENRTPIINHRVRN